MSQNAILILAPHPDDEILNCSSILSLSKNVVVAYATNGDFVGRDATEVRYHESLSAMQKLGLGAKNMVYMGYGDRGGKKTSSFLAALWNSEPDTIHTTVASRCTYGVAGHPEYHYQRHSVHAPYTRRAFLDDLKDLLQQINPRFIFLPSHLDFHWDHSCLNRLTHYALGQLDISPICFSFLTHYGRDSNWPNRNGSDFLMPEGLPPDLWSRRIEVPVSKAKKSELLACFPSQKTKDGYLDAFCKKQEIYWSEMMEANHAKQDTVDPMFSW